MQRGAVTADKANIIREKKDCVNITVVILKFRWNGQSTRKIEVTKTDSRKHRKPEQTYYH